MYVDDPEIPMDKLAETARRVMGRAVEESRRREHPLLTSAHLFFAVALADWDLFARAMRDAGVNPHHVVRAVDEHLRRMPPFAGSELRVSHPTRLVCKLAYQRAVRAGRPAVEAADLLLALFEETRGVPASILRQCGAEPGGLASRLDTHIRDLELRNERLKKCFELPPSLKQFATNLNLLAWLDKLPPVSGRDREIQQILEILSHRERGNSAMLVGEPGVGKTAIAEELARRLEFEPDSIPVRLRDSQIINLQMNAIVAGTMLRGMFEDRLQSVINEVKSRPNLILFVDEAHTIVGAGSALGAPSDAGQILKAALSRGEVRMIAATTLSEYKQHIQEDEALAGVFAASR